MYAELTLFKSKLLVSICNLKPTPFMYFRVTEFYFAMKGEPLSSFYFYETQEMYEVNKELSADNLKNKSGLRKERVSSVMNRRF